MIKIIIPGTPVAKGRPRLGKYGTYTPEKTVNYENLVQYAYMDQAEGKKLQGALQMVIDLYFPIAKSYSKKRVEVIKEMEEMHTKKPDASNCLKSIEDALNGFAYRDDSQVVKVVAEKFYSTEPRAKVIINEVF